MGLTASTRTITWDEVYNAWTSFHSYVPEWTERLGTNFYSFKNGQLYIHDKNETRTNFYGTNYGCSVTYSSNKQPSDIKLFKTVGLETNSSSWYSSLTSEMESGVIGNSTSQKFEDKEGIKYGYIRRSSNDDLDFNKLSILGIGNLQSTPSSNEYQFTNNIPNQVSFNDNNGVGGDKLYFNNGSTLEIGIIDSVSGKNITTTASANTPSVGDFCFVVKNPESESYGLRGYHAKITLTNNSTSFVELFGSNTEVFISEM